jgi:hypothetical protein
MSCRVEAIDEFKRNFKRLSKKFRTLNAELNELIIELEDNPKLGKSLGAGLYKIRLASDSKGGGKSGGFRVITYYVEETDDSEIVYLITIYDKSEEDSIKKNELLKITKALIE